MSCWQIFSITCTPYSFVVMAPQDFRADRTRIKVLQGMAGLQWVLCHFHSLPSEQTTSIPIYSNELALTELWLCQLLKQQRGRLISPFDTYDIYQSLYNAIININLCSFSQRRDNARPFLPLPKRSNRVRRYIAHVIVIVGLGARLEELAHGGNSETHIEHWPRCSLSIMGRYTSAGRIPAKIMYSD